MNSTCYEREETLKIKKKKKSSMKTRVSYAIHYDVRCSLYIFNEKKDKKVNLYHKWKPNMFATF